MRIECFKSKGKWFFRVVAKNGEIVAASEAYENKVDCISTAKSLRRKLFFAAIIEV